MEIHFESIAEYSELSDEVWNIRLLVSNKEGKHAAKNLEVFLKNIRVESTNHELHLPKYFPIRLQWAHDGGPLCDRIAGGTARLLDFCQIESIKRTSTAMRGTPKWLEDYFGQSPISLNFVAEVAPKIPLNLPIGIYVLEFLIVCDSTIYSQNATVTIRNQHLEKGKPLSDYFEIQTS